MLIHLFSLSVFSVLNLELNDDVFIPEVADKMKSILKVAQLEMSDPLYDFDINKLSGLELQTCFEKTILNGIKSARSIRRLESIEFRVYKLRQERIPISNNILDAIHIKLVQLKMPKQVVKPSVSSTASLDLGNHVRKVNDAVDSESNSMRDKILPAEAVVKPEFFLYVKALHELVFKIQNIKPTHLFIIDGDFKAALIKTKLNFMTALRSVLRNVENIENTVSILVNSENGNPELRAFIHQSIIEYGDWDVIKSYNRLQTNKKNRLFQHPVLGYS